MSVVSEMRRWRIKRDIKLARREAIRNRYACERCGIYRSSAAIRRYAEELPVDLRGPDNWLALCEYCRAEEQAERRALRRGGIALTPRG